MSKKYTEDNFIDLTGTINNSGAIVKSFEKYCKNGCSRTWKMICSCGKKEFLASEKSIIENKLLLLCPSCKSKKSAKIDNSLEGKRFGKLLAVIRSNYKGKDGNCCFYWECICDCGKLAIVARNSLLIGDTMSCGCLQKESASKHLTKYLLKNSKTGVRDIEGELERKISIKTKGKLYSLTRYIYKRDNYTCCLCDSKNGINAHHINSWCGFPELRYDEMNLITLCKTHHDNFHLIYGRGWNTQEQFSEYLQTLNIDLESLLVKFNQYKLKNKASSST